MKMIMVMAKAMMTIMMAKVQTIMMAMVMNIMMHEFQSLDHNGDDPGENQSYNNMMKAW